MHYFLQEKLEIPESIQTLTEAEDLPWEPSPVVIPTKDGGYERALRPSTRNSETALLSPEVTPKLWQWFSNVVTTRVLQYLEDTPIGEYFERLVGPYRGQIIRYEAGHFYYIHHDMIPVKQESEDDEYRVIQCALGLSNEEDYEGGELEFIYDPSQFKLSKGDLLVFPCPSWHILWPVITGKRKVMLIEYTAKMTKGNAEKFEKIHGPKDPMQQIEMHNKVKKEFREILGSEWLT